LKNAAGRGWFICPRCGSEKHAFIKTRRIWECYGCKKQFSLKVGTIFEDSALGLDKWMMAIWMLTNCKNGVSSYEMARTIGITQKSASLLDFFGLRTGFVCFFAVDFGYAKEMGQSLFKLLCGLWAFVIFVFHVALQES
jgi:Transposase zinc-ribbon domain